MKPNISAKLGLNGFTRPRESTKLSGTYILELAVPTTKSTTNHAIPRFGWTINLRLSNRPLKITLLTLSSSWLSDSSVTKYITDEAGLKLVADVKASPARLHEAILTQAARRMATHLFLNVEFLKRHFVAAACFLRGFLARVRLQII